MGKIRSDWRRKQPKTCVWVSAVGGRAFCKGLGQEYECYSASIRDKGVRRKVMPLPSAKWDLIPLLSTPEAHKQLQRVWTATEGQGYDLMCRNP